MSKMTWGNFLRGLNLALKSNTTYALGGFGWQLTDAYKERLLKNSNNKPFEKAIKAGTISTFAFDCVCLLKGILWGWNANNKVNYGGAVYNSNGVPDVDANQMMTTSHVSGLTTDFSKIKVGAFVGMKGHIGVYIGNGKVIECTPIWGAKVMTTNLSDRKWVNWGMSKYIDYSQLDKPVLPETAPAPVSTPNGKATINPKALYKSKSATYNNKPVSSAYIGVPLEYTFNHDGDTNWVFFPSIKSYVDKSQVTIGGTSTKKSNTEIASEVKLGLWGNGAERKNGLTSAGYDYDVIQALVNASAPKPAPIKEGDKVVVVNPIQYTGGTFRVFHPNYDVISANGDRIVIGKGKVTTAAVNVVNLKKV